MNTAYYDMLTQLQHQTKKMIRENTSDAELDMKPCVKTDKAPRSRIYKLDGCDANKLILEFDQLPLTAGCSG